MGLFRMLTGLFALLGRALHRPVPDKTDRLKTENLELRRKADDLRTCNVGLVREKRALHDKAEHAEIDATLRIICESDTVDQVRRILRGQGVNIGRPQVPAAVRQLVAELSLLREKVGADILRREGLESCGTGVGPDGHDWSSGGGGAPR